MTVTFPDDTFFFMIRRHTFATLFLVLLLGLALQDLRPAAAASGDVRVVYLFNPDSPDQIARLAQLQRRAEIAGNVDLSAVSQTSPLPPGISAVYVGRFLEDPTIDAMTRRWISQRLGRGDDALRVHRPDAVYTSDGTTIERTAVYAGMALVATDIDFSTWGKVKDLFR